MGKTDKGAKQDHEEDQVFRMVALLVGLATKNSRGREGWGSQRLRWLKRRCCKMSVSWVVGVIPSTIGPLLATHECGHKDGYSPPKLQSLYCRNNKIGGCVHVDPRVTLF